MSNRNNFAGGFFLGAVVGGVLGGVLGATLASNRGSSEPLTPEELAKRPKKRLSKPPTETSIEAARRGLEDKIAQLNVAIDDVRQQLSDVNSNGSQEADAEKTFARDF